MTDDADLAGRLRTFRHHGIVRDAARLSRDEGPWYYEIHELGHNFRITDFQCALGLSQLTKLDGFLARRREIVAAYTKALSRLEEIELVRAPSDRASAHHLFVIQLRPERLRADRRAIFEALRREGLGVQVHYVPVHYHPLYQRRFGYRRGDYPKTERYYERAITLPLFPAMTDEDVQDVIATVERVIVGARR